MMLVPCTSNSLYHLCTVSSIILSSFLFVFLAELDSEDPKMFSKPSRIKRIAKASDHTINDVHELLENCKRLVRLKTMRVQLFLEQLRGHGVL